MGTKISVNLNDSTAKFLDSVTNNRSAYINQLIEEKQKQAFEDKLRADYREQNDDPQWQAEIELWDCVAGDGLQGIEGMEQIEVD